MDIQAHYQRFTVRIIILIPLLPPIYIERYKFRGHRKDQPPKIGIPISLYQGHPVVPRKSDGNLVLLRVAWCEQLWRATCRGQTVDPQILK